MKKVLATLAIAALALVAARADDVVIQYNYGDGTTGTLAPSTQADSFTATNTAKGGGGTLTNPSSTVSGIGNFASANVWGTTSLNSADYYTFTITNGNATDWNFTGFTFDAGRSNTGPQNWELRSNAAADNFTTTLLSGGSIPNGNGSQNNSGSWGNFGGSFSLLIPAGTSEEFRLYGFNASNGNTGTFRIDNVTFTAAVVPEPGTVAILALGSLGLGLFARRRRMRS
jgi:PEP-CTERM motif